jgi:hypothetical protein
MDCLWLPRIDHLHLVGPRVHAVGELLAGKSLLLYWRPDLICLSSATRATRRDNGDDSEGRIASAPAFGHFMPQRRFGHA